MNALPISEILAKRHDVVSLIVFHLSDAVSTRTAVPPERLESYEGVARFTSAQAQAIDDGFAALRSSVPRLSATHADTRWGAVFTSASGARILAVYCDKFGHMGAIDGESVAFESDGVVRWLRQLAR